MEVLYEIQGDTESEYKVSDAQDFHGATFGKEVDDEPNVPEWADKVSQPNLISVPISCLLYTSPSPRDATLSRMPSSA